MHIPSVLSLGAVAVVAAAAGAAPVVDPVHDPGVFPIAVWAMPARTAPAFAKMGVNLFVADQGEPVGWCDTLAANGIVGFVHWDPRRTPAQNEAIAASPGFLGWMHGDEPDNPGVVDDVFHDWHVAPETLAEHTRQMRASSTPAPMYLNLGQGLANGTNQTTPDSVYAEFCATADVLCYDVYPTSTQPDGARRLHLVARGIEHLRAVSGGDKPVWIWLECTAIRGDAGGLGNRAPYPHELRAEVWMSLVHGADGIGYFPHQFDPYRGGPEAIPAALRAEMTRTNGLLQSLAPLLCGDRHRLAVDAADGEVHAALWQGDGRTLLALVNMRPETARATVLLPPGLPGLRRPGGELVDAAAGLTLRPYEVVLLQDGTDAGGGYDYPEPPLPEVEPEAPVVARLDDLPPVRADGDAVVWARSPQTRLLAPALPRAPRLDGDLDDPAWRGAARLEMWTDPGGTRRPREATTGWVGVHGDRLYLAFRAHEPQLDSLVTRYPALWRNDCIEVWFDPDNRRTSFAHIQVDADGRVAAKRTVQDDWGEGRRDESWSPAIEARSGRQDGAWTVELAIRLRDLDVGTRVVGFDAARERKPGGGENSVWTLGGFNEARAFGELLVAPATVSLQLANGVLANRSPAAVTVRVERRVSAPAAAAADTWEGQWSDRVREQLTVRVPAGGTADLLGPDLARRVPAGGRVQLRLLGHGPDQFEEFVVRDAP